MSHLKQLNGFLKADIFSGSFIISVLKLSSLLIMGWLFNSDCISQSLLHVLLSIVQIQLTFKEDITKVLFLVKDHLVQLYACWCFLNFLSKRIKREKGASGKGQFIISNGQFWNWSYDSNLEFIGSRSRHLMPFFGIFDEIN